MRVYETILSILDEKGPLPIPEICYEVNQALIQRREKPLQPSHIKSIVTKKSELFSISEGEISIAPDKHPISLIATLESFAGISYQVRINFIKNSFTALEWRNKENNLPFSNLHPLVAGNIEDFKRELYSLKIWEWKHEYQKNDGIVLEGSYWSVKLKTLEKLYESDGIECFPKNWGKFSKAIEKLTGTAFHL